MKILVTGGAGFIGGNFIYYMMKKYSDYHIFCLDALTYAANPNTLSEAQKNKNFSFIKGDITDRFLVEKLFLREKFDFVVNFAAESHVDKSIEDSEIFLKTNILGTQVIMDNCRKFGNIRFHQVSTDEVYGDLPLDKPNLLFTEDSHIRPSNPYSASKAAADMLVQAYHRTYNLPITISRCGNNYGPFQFPEKMIPKMLLKVLANEKLPIYGNGKHVRDWLYVEDHCSAIDLIIHQGKIGAVYNIGAHNEKTNIEVIENIIYTLGQNTDLISFVEDRAGHDLRYAIDFTKIQKELGWSPKIKFADGINKTINWYLENKSWWKKL